MTFVRRCGAKGLFVGPSNCRPDDLPDDHTQGSSRKGDGG